MKQYFETFPNSYAPESKRIINTPSDIAKSTFFYVQETGYLKIIKSHSTRRENLDSYLFVVVLSGKGVLNYEGKEYNLSANECFFINCIHPHSYKSSDDEPWELLWVHFNGSTTREYYEYFKTLCENVIRSINCSRIIEIINDLLEIHSEKGVFTEAWASKLVVDLLTEVITVTHTDVAQISPNITNRLNSVRHYIDDNFTEKICLQEVADKFFVSQAHLSREFKRIFGITFSGYIISKRIIYAKRLLRFSDKSISEISNDCGIIDANHFNKLFKKAESITASAYRKKWRN